MENISSFVTNEIYQIGSLAEKIKLLHGKIVWLKFAWIEQQTLLPTFRYIDLFQDKFAFTLNQIQITLKGKFGES